MVWYKTRYNDFAKGLGGGFPVGAVLMTNKVAKRNELQAPMAQLLEEIN